MRARIAKLVSVVSVVLGLAYPVMVFWGLQHFSLASITAVLVAVIGLRLVATGVARGFDWKQGAGALGLAAMIGLWFLVVKDHVGLLLVPTAINAAMLVVFGSTLLDVPLIERFARRFDDNLTDEKKAHCREFTILWCVFFVVNGTVCTLLAIYAPRALWALYTGIISYILMGGMFALEFVVRRYRFRQFSSRAPDRWLRHILR